MLGEDWCGDVIRGLPVLSRIAEAAGMEISIFPRDQHHDIMNEFLKNGEYMSIPVAVFYTGDHDYICHWIERPEIAETEMHQMETDIRAENPGIDDQAFGKERRARTGARCRLLDRGNHPGDQGTADQECCLSRVWLKPGFRVQPASAAPVLDRPRPEHRRFPPPSPVVVDVVIIGFGLGLLLPPGAPMNRKRKEPKEVERRRLDAIGIT